MSTWTEKKEAVIVAQAPVLDRLAFLKKVYTLLTLSLGTAVFAGWFTITTPAFLLTVANNHLLFIILQIGLIFICFAVRKKENISFFALFAFTTLSGITASPIVFTYLDVAFQASVLTMLAFGSLTSYVFITKKDFSFMRGFLIVGLILLVVGGLLNAFFFKSSGLSYFMSIGGIFIFCGFILYDTSMIMKRYPTDEYISATLALYLDILNLFLYILTFLGLSRD